MGKFYPLSVDNFVGQLYNIIKQEIVGNTMKPEFTTLKV